MGKVRASLYKKPGSLHYLAARAVSWLVSTFVFRRKMLRNEIRDKKGPFVVIANHEAALDFVNLIGACRRPMSFVISYSFFSTLPIKGFLEKMGVIPKQQFQTTVSDLKKMKAVIEQGQPLVIYPAGLMCEDGLSTPIPSATYKFLKWLDADVYAARTAGTYFVMPKWSSKLRPGRTYMDVYRLFTRDELAEADVNTVREKVDAALLYDAYAEQETLMVKYAGGNDIRGLENVLCVCPGCGGEFTMTVQNRSRLVCSACGYEEESDERGFLHKKAGPGEELRRVSDWSAMIQSRLEEDILSGREKGISCGTEIYMIDGDKNKFVSVGRGTVSLTKDNFTLSGVVKGEETEITVPTASLPTLPFSPGKYLEIQEGMDIYRCALSDGRLVMKFINMLKIFHRLSTGEALERRKSIAAK